MLVLLCTISSANDCCVKMTQLLKHDSSTSILPLYAALDEERRNLVVNLCETLANAGRRLVCFSTNVAEAGITIPGVTAVVETGQEINVEYDITLKANIGSVGWIRKFSQIQRRGHKPHQVSV